MPLTDLLLRNVILAGQAGRYAIAISGERIIWVGPDRDATQWQRATTIVIDGDGMLALPGLTDCHFHLHNGARALGVLRLEDVQSVAELQSRLATYAAAHPHLPWLIGRGWRYRLFADGQVPDRRLLDAVVPDRPVLLTAFDGHTAWANTVALQIAGILGGAETGHPFSTVVMGADGRASGELREAPAMDLVRRCVPPPTEAELRDLLRRALRELAALGLTGVHNMDGDEAQRTRYRELAAAGELTLRIRVPLSLSPGTDPDRIAAWAADAHHHPHPFVQTDAVKLFVDGVVEAKTALMIEPYADGSGERGVANYDPAEFVDLITRADAAGLQVCVHAIGDGGVRQTLEAFATAQRVNGRRDARHRIEHAEIVDPTDIPRFATLGVIASVQPLHVDFGMDLANPWWRLVGPQRHRFGFPWRDLLRAGTQMALGSDWPVADPDPLRGIQVACTRGKLDLSPLESDFPDQRLTVAEALAGYTTWAAYAGFREHELGRLAPGYVADLVLLDRDITCGPPDQIAAAQVMLTMVGGKVVFER
ncbi:amidohydrolase [uncultured Chloroflexus sp.]|uniref:amidohydrolase n=1 Tax=uncultured Chloroflexus sp. TaxID=214040 RepID=UPI0026330EE4|nr:amidohydrolase [uncultured Chloroflexus sp.]